jgi:dTDP-4-dehydrorhamnose 3,5-epimerase
LRGLHYQVRVTQGKLVRAVEGEILDVAVDLRRSSPTFGKWQAVRLSGENKRMLWIPPAFAHGFFVVSEKAQVLYKSTDYYSPSDERTISWNDPDLNIDWELDGVTPIVSQKDRQGAAFREAESFA